MQEAIEWPVTWKPPHQKKAQNTWTHHYCFTVKESHEKIARIASGGIGTKLSLNYIQFEGFSLMRFVQWFYLSSKPLSHTVCKCDCLH